MPLKESPTPDAVNTGVDYNQYMFSKTFEREPQGMFPVNFLREYIPGVKKLKPTNRWQVTLLDPKLGICTFYLVKNGRNWLLDKIGVPKATQVPEKEIVDWCGAELTAHLL